MINEMYTDKRNNASYVIIKFIDMTSRNERVLHIDGDLSFIYNKSCRPKIDIFSSTSKYANKRNLTSDFKVESINKDRIRISGSDTFELDSIVIEDIVRLKEPQITEEEVRFKLEMGYSIYTFEGKVKIEKHW